MPLTRLKDEYLEEDGVRFSMADENGTSVACGVNHDALRDHATAYTFPAAMALFLTRIAN